MPRGKGRTRQEGESVYAMNRRLGTYEDYREDFERWIYDDRLTQFQISERCGKSISWVNTVAQTLEITRRAARGEGTRVRESRAMSPQTIALRKELRRTYGRHAPLLAIIRAYTAAWDRGW
jgi:hypothetical protein